jgi:hypothetical protein
MKKTLELEMLKALSKHPAHRTVLTDLAETTGQGDIMLAHLSNKSYVQNIEFGWQLTKLGALRLRALRLGNKPVGLPQSSVVKGKLVTQKQEPKFFRQGAEDAGVLPSLVNGTRVF